MKFFFTLGLLIFTHGLFAEVKELKIPRSIYHNEEQIFLPHIEALAMTIDNAPIHSLRVQLEEELKIKLDFFKGWNPQGEAHITVITPPEFEKIKHKLSMSEINAIAERYEIQNSRLMILGLGKGKSKISENDETTYFVIVDSYELRLIRQMIFYEFIRRGGDRSVFDPTWFFPHITIGYTKRDLHEADGVIKNLKNSLDQRFVIKTI